MMVRPGFEPKANVGVSWNTLGLVTCPRKWEEPERRDLFFSFLISFVGMCGEKEQSLATDMPGICPLWEVCGQVWDWGY